MSQEPRDADQTGLGLERGVVRLLPYQPSWPECFQLEASRLGDALDARVGFIEHMGSTAIPGLAAKPIIDFMASVADFDAAENLIPDIETLGYEYREADDIPDRYFFVGRRNDGMTTYHLSLAQSDSAYWTAHLLFRDFLRANPGLAQEYAELKRELAAKHQHDRLAYMRAKRPFVKRVLRLARESSLAGSEGAE
jgi:GrpB-like predicted nucleotidyltransferase (UPF0157 family)